MDVVVSMVELVVDTTEVLGAPVDVGAGTAWAVEVGIETARSDSLEQAANKATLATNIVEMEVRRTQARLGDDSD